MKKIFLIIILLSQCIFAYDQIVVKNIEIKNDKEIPIEILENAMGLKVGSNYTSDQMIKDFIKVKNLEYIENVKINPKIEPDGINLVVEITEKPNVKELLKSKGIIPNSEVEQIDKSLTIKDISITGLTYLKEEDYKNLIPLNIGGYFSKIKALEARKTLLDNGCFYSVEPSATKFEDGIYLEYKVIENPYIDKIEIEGNKIFSDEIIKEFIISKEHQVFNYNSLKNDKTAIEKKYQDSGYGLAQIYDIKIDPENKRIIFYISEGIVKDIKFRKISSREEGERRNTTGSGLKTNDFVIQREIVLEKGKPFETAKFETTAKNLFRLGFFKNVTQEFESVPNDPSSKIVTFILDEQKTASYQGTVSYGSSSGLVGTASVQDTNFKGKGQTLSLSGSLGESSTESMSLNFSDPWIKDTNKISWGWSLYKSTYEDDDSTDAYYVTKEGFKINFGKALTDKIRLRIGPKIELDTEKNEDEEVTDKFKTISILPALIYDTRNNVSSATEGSYASLEFELGRILDRNNYTTTELELRKYHKGFFENNNFAYRTVIGIGSDQLRDSQKFRVGGGSSLRGYDSGDFKGNYELYTNLENRTQLNDNFEVVGFFDFGRAWDQTNTSTTSDIGIGQDIKMTCGIGLRIQTPIGPLRFDYGWPLGDSDTTGGQFYFNIGQLF